MDRVKVSSVVTAVLAAWLIGFWSWVLELASPDARPIEAQSNAE